MPSRNQVSGLSQQTAELKDQCIGDKSELELLKQIQESCSRETTEKVKARDYDEIRAGL